MEFKEIFLFVGYLVVVINAQNIHEITPQCIVVEEGDTVQCVKCPRLWYYDTTEFECKLCQGPHTNCMASTNTNTKCVDKWSDCEPTPPQPDNNVESNVAIKTTPTKRPLTTPKVSFEAEYPAKTELPARPVDEHVEIIVWTDKKFGTQELISWVVGILGVVILCMLVLLCCSRMKKMSGESKLYNPVTVKQEKPCTSTRIHQV